MGRITFVLGGARSGKSSFAIKLADASGGRVAFVATCQGLDDEMRKRIAIHKKTRPSTWKTFEEPLNVGAVIKKISPKFNIILIDCLTLLVSNLIMKHTDNKVIEGIIAEMIAKLKCHKSDSIIVSNEVGLGIVPNNRLGRDFRDIGGRVNQIVAKKADIVYFMVSGIAMKIK